MPLLAALLLIGACGSGEPDGPSAGVPNAEEAAEPDAQEAGATEADEDAELWGPPDVFETLAAEVGTDGRLTLDAALSMFALQYGELPGATVPSGDPGPARSGDLAIASVLYRWSELTGAQRVAVRAALEVEPDWEPAAPGPESGSEPNPAASDDAAEKEAQEQEGREEGTWEASGAFGRSVAWRGDAIAAYRASLRPLEEVLERHLGPLGAQIDLVASRGVLRAENGEQALADALLVEPDRCRIRVYPAVFPAPSGPNFSLAHELFHCYQQRWNGSPLGAGLAWVEEGGAEWVAAVAMSEVGAPVDPDLRDWLAQYYMTPERPLFRRTYEAVGWWGFIAKHTGPMWGRLRSISTAGDSEPAYAAALGGAAGATLASDWASTQAGRGAYGPRWSVISTGLPRLNSSQPPGYPILRNGATQAFTAPPYATGQGSAALEAELTKFNAIPPTDGVIRIGNEDRRLSGLTGTTWCTDPEGRCTCPAGTVRAGQTFPRLEGTEALVAVGAADQAASLTIQGVSLEEECGREDVCPIGKWQMNALPTGLPFVIDSGGTGTIITVDPDGLLTQDFSEFVPMWAYDPDDPLARMYFEPSGFVTARVRVPTGTERIVDEPVLEPDPAGLGGTGRVEIRGEVALSLTSADMQAIAIAARGQEGARLSCVSDDTLTLSAGRIVHTYERVS